MRAHVTKPQSAQALRPVEDAAERPPRTRLKRQLYGLLTARWGIKALVIAIVLTLAIPLNAVIFAVVWHLSDKANELQRTSLLYTARSVAGAVDAKLGEYMALAQALMRSPALLEENLEVFEAEARRAFSGRDAWVLVADADGQQLFNMTRRSDKALPIRSVVTKAAQKRAFETRSSVITGVRVGSVSQDWIINVEVPVFKDGLPFRVLAVVIRARSFLHLLNDRQIPVGWLACVTDHEGRFVARVPGYESNVGQLSAEGFRKIKDQDGIFEFLSVEGDSIVTANAHSAISGWPVAIAVKKAELQAATWSTIRWAAILGGGLSFLSLLFAGAISRRITGPIAALRDKAGALLTDPASVKCPAGPREVGDLWEAMKQSSDARDRSDRALRESEERFRGIFEHAGTGIAIADLGGRFQTCNPAYSVMLGYREDELQGRHFAELVHPEDRDANLLENKRLVAQEIPSFGTVNRYIRKDGKSIWVYKYVSLLRDAAGKPNNVIVLVTDISDRKRHEDRINLLMREVNHRSKNMLTLVQVVARRTLAAKPEVFIERFGERIRALSASQDLLVKSEWTGVDLDELVRSQLGHFEDLIGSRIELTGPQVIISANAAQAIGMALHELATNAGKYGALSNADGRIEVSWDLKPGTFVMTWRERNGPAVVAPQRTGFGSTVLCQVKKENLDAEVDLNYAATGLVWQLKCAAEEVIEGAALTNSA